MAADERLPEVLTICVTLPGKILLSCHHWWHNPTRNALPSDVGLSGNWTSGNQPLGIEIIKPGMISIAPQRLSNVSLDLRD